MVSSLDSVAPCSPVHSFSSMQSCEEGVISEALQHSTKVSSSGASQPYFPKTQTRQQHASYVQSVYFESQLIFFYVDAYLFSFEAESLSCFQIQGVPLVWDL